MKSEMTEALEEKKFNLLPALYIRDDNEPIIVFADIQGNATVVYTEDECYEIGEVISDWKFYDLKLFNGEVKLSNN